MSIPVIALVLYDAAVATPALGLIAELHEVGGISPVVKTPFQLWWPKIAHRYYLFGQPPSSA